MKTINRLMRERLFLEYKLSSIPNDDTLITELHGMPSEIENITKKCSEELKAILYSYNRHQQPIKQEVGFDLNSAFAKHIVILISVNKNNGLSFTDCSAAFSNKNSIYSEKNRWFDVVYIKCIIETGLEQVGLNDILPSIAHELAHAYEDWNRRCNGTKTVFDTANDRGYDKIINSSNITDSFEDTLNSILYITTDVERNAFITEIIAEVKPYLLNCDSSASAFNTLNKRSETWKHIMATEKCIYLFSILNNEGVKQLLIKRWNLVTKQNVIVYNVFLRRLGKRWNIFKKKLVSSLGKQIADIALSSPNWQYLNPHKFRMPKITDSIE